MFLYQQLVKTCYNIMTNSLTRSNGGKWTEIPNNLFVELYFLVKGYARSRLNIWMIHISNRYSGFKKTRPKLLCVARNVTHPIATTGHVFSRAIRLAHENLGLVKNLFEHMVDFGNIQLSKDPWAAPLHLISTKDCTDCCLNGGYQRPNTKKPLPTVNLCHKPATS